MDNLLKKVRLNLKNIIMANNSNLVRKRKTVGKAKKGRKS
jgi:hypothetical protein